MNEKEFDSSNINYEEINKPSEYIKKTEWDMAIGLQEVDNLKPSKYLSSFIPKRAQGIVRPLAVLSVLPAVTPVFFFKGS